MNLDLETNSNTLIHILLTESKGKITNVHRLKSLAV